MHLVLWKIHFFRFGMLYMSLKTEIRLQHSHFYYKLCIIFDHAILLKGLLKEVSSVAFITEPRYDKTNKVSVRPANAQISLGIRSVWSESSLSAWGSLGPLATHWVHSEDSDQTGRLPRLIWVFAGCTLILLVLSCGGSITAHEQTQ